MSARNSHAAKAARRAEREHQPRLTAPAAAVSHVQAVSELLDLAHRLSAIRLDDEMAVHGSTALWVSGHGRLFTHDGSPLPAGLRLEPPARRR
jgi:hypothetical protein